ncbi:hypothetical protein Tco_0174406 [Tanacetum coccineum]
MSNFLKNQGTWKLTQLKKLNFEEVKAEFENLVKQLDTYVPMNFEATKESTQPTKENIEKDKDDKPTKKSGKRRKQIARKGFHTDHGRDESEDSDEANEKDNSTSGTKIPIDPAPVARKSPSVANYKIIKQGRKGVYQIVRENGTDMSADVYMLIERKYHLSVEVCKVMLDKKLQGEKLDEDCYKLLKMMEKQAVEMVFSRPWTCTFLVAKGLATPELMANCCLGEDCWEIYCKRLNTGSITVKSGSIS